MTTEDASTWKRCNTCKKPIAFASGYFTCNVSTCNRKGTDFAFCSVSCWDAHVPVLRHRDAWAEEQRAPTAAAWAERQRAEAERAVAAPAAEPRVPARRPRRRAARRVGGGEAIPHDVLVVVSKLKAYVRARSGMNTSDGVTDVLSDRLRTLCDQAIEQARAARPEDRARPRFRRRRCPVTPKIPAGPLRQPRYLHVRRSRLHGRGVFTTRAVPQGTLLLEYLGERISHRGGGRALLRRDGARRVRAALHRRPHGRHRRRRRRSRRALREPLVRAELRGRRDRRAHLHHEHPRHSRRR